MFILNMAEKEVTSSSNSENNLYFIQSNCGEQILVHKFYKKRVNSKICKICQTSSDSQIFINIILSNKFFIFCYCVW